jgi:hypothetical protein
MTFNWRRDAGLAALSGLLSDVYFDLPQQYDLKRFPFMRPQGAHADYGGLGLHSAALWIRDSEGALWTLGFDYDEAEWRGGNGNMTSSATVARPANSSQHRVQDQFVRQQGCQNLGR